MEHLAVQLVPRLRVHPTRRVACRRRAVGSKRAGDLPALRALARRQLELRALGLLSRAAADCHEDGTRIEPGSRKTAALACNRAGRGDVHPDLHWMALL